MSNQEEALPAGREAGVDPSESGEATAAKNRKTKRMSVTSRAYYDAIIAEEDEAMMSEADEKESEISAEDMVSYMIGR